MLRRLLNRTALGRIIMIPFRFLPIALPYPALRCSLALKWAFTPGQRCFYPEDKR
jgi:hypothetical protein